MPKANISLYSCDSLDNIPLITATVESIKDSDNDREIILGISWCQETSNSVISTMNKYQYVTQIIPGFYLHGICYSKNVYKVIRISGISEENRGVRERRFKVNIAIDINNKGISKEDLKKMLIEEGWNIEKWRMTY